ncbi:hypothetical protein [Motiliproteus sp. SC1-56]|uniref:glycosyltransferase n=1 Tax=Motiliproteus sp. SC1-56 TaxID=2799565 RepID=UPI001A9047B7|nr:hypothetical protein [Motiliproteus sp. SC1-56]
MKIFIGPVEICGIAEGLNHGFSELGVPSKVVLSSPHPHGYITSNGFWLYSLWKKLGSVRKDTARSKIIKKVFYVVLHVFFTWLVFFHSLFSFKVYIFLYSRSITDSKLELLLLRLFRKKVIFISVGTDTRPPYMSGAFLPYADADKDIYELSKVVSKYKQKIALHEKYADYIVNAPGTGQFHNKKFINWFSVGVPKLLQDVSCDKSSESAPMRILHCPSNPTAKGSGVISDVIDNLKSKGHRIDFIKIENVPNDVVLDQLSRCDFVIDQLYSDTPLAVFATEAAHFGKPAVVGGYFSSDINKFVTFDDIPPSLYVSPENIEEAVEKMITDDHFRLELGRKAKSFVDSKWTPRDVASRYMRLINDSVPETWWCDPQTITYVYGAGLPRWATARMVRGMVERFGVQSLKVSDKPQLEHELLNMAGLSDFSTHD